MNLIWLLNNIQEGQIAKAVFADDVWFVKKEAGSIRYWFENISMEVVPLTYSNINAYYEILD